MRLLLVENAECLQEEKHGRIRMLPAADEEVYLYFPLTGCSAQSVVNNWPDPLTREQTQEHYRPKKAFVPAAQGRCPEGLLAGVRFGTGPERWGGPSQKEWAPSCLSLEKVKVIQ